MLLGSYVAFKLVRRGRFVAPYRCSRLKCLISVGVIDIDLEIAIITQTWPGSRFGVPFPFVQFVAEYW